MKKVLATLVLVLIASTVSAAEVKVGAWGRGFFVPYYSDGASDARSYDAVSWGTAPRVGVTIAGNSDNAGFQVDFNGDGGSINPGDQQKIWVKPIDMLTVSIGRAYDDTLRGNGTFGSFDWLRISWTGEDVTFARVSTYDGPFGRGGQGAIFALDPMKELHAYVAFKNLGGSGNAQPNDDGDTNGNLTVTDAMKNITVGAGFTIGNLGVARAQYIGNVTPDIDAVAEVTDEEGNVTTEGKAKIKTTDKSAVNAAFKLTMVQNLYADLGMFYYTKSDDAGKDMVFAAYVKYTMGAIGIHALANITMGGKDIKGKDATGIEAGLGLDYAIGNGLGVVADFRYLDEVAAGVKDGNMGGMVGVEKGFSNGKIGAGVEFATAVFASQPEVNDGKTIASEEMTIAIPVKVEYWF